MADDEQAAIPALETASETEQQVETTELEPSEQPVEGEEGQDETDELDFGFEKYVVPKKLKEAVEALRADATQKTQTVSARQKALDEREAQISQQAEVTEAELNARADLKRVTSEMERFKDYDYTAFQTHYRQNPMEATEAWAYKTHLQNQKAELDGSLGKYATERTEKAQSDLTKRVQETLAEAPKIIPNFKADSISKLVDTLQTEFEVPESVIKANWSPTFLRIAHLASVGLELTRKTAAAAAKPAPTPEPLKVVTARSNPSPTALSDNLSAEEWTRRRNAQLKKRAS